MSTRAVIQLKKTSNRKVEDRFDVLPNGMEYGYALGAWCEEGWEAFDEITEPLGLPSLESFLYEPDAADAADILGTVMKDAPPQIKPLVRARYEQAQRRQTRWHKPEDALPTLQALMNYYRLQEEEEFENIEMDLSMNCSILTWAAQLGDQFRIRLKYQ
jgi:hypothetical protein